MSKYYDSANKNRSSDYIKHDYITSKPLKAACCHIKT